MYVSAGACGVQQGAPDYLEPESQAVVSHLAWLLGTELRAISLAPLSPFSLFLLSSLVLGMELKASSTL